TLASLVWLIPVVAQSATGLSACLPCSRVGSRCWYSPVRRWHAARWFGLPFTGSRTGSMFAQMSSTAIGQRGWKRQPVGGSVGFGTLGVLALLPGGCVVLVFDRAQAARRQMVRVAVHRQQDRLDVRADVEHGDRAARVEAAAGRRVERVRDLALRERHGAAALRVGHGHG